MKKRNNHSKISFLAILLSLCLTATGCLSSPLYEYLYSEIAEEESSSPYSFFPDIEIPSDSEPGSEYEPDYGENNNTFSEYETPTIHNDEEFNDYMEYMMRRRECNLYFYTANGFSINNDILLYRFSLPYVSSSSTPMPDGTDYYSVYITYYPGTLIADAYFSGNIDSLSTDEIKTLSIATDFIENEVRYATDPVEKEILIHDFICENTVYTNPSSSDKIPRHCTAVGLLLDGAANCQGYTDCFYMLGTMAGLTVDKQSGYGDGNMHVWNIVELSGEWRAVDVTYDDTTFFSEGGGHPAYIYLNAGKDIMNISHTVDSKNELRPIAKTSNQTYGYYSGYIPYSGWGTSEATADSEIASLLTDSYQNGYPYASYFLKDQTAYPNDLATDVQSYIKSKPRPITITVFWAGNHTFILAEPE